MESEQDILRRIREIEQLIQRLSAERTALLNLRNNFWRSEAHLLPGEQTNARNARKFELLGKLQNFLKYTAKANKSGVREASTREIYDHLVTNYNETMKYGTFRSHLSRFKEEGRLNFNQSRSRWSIATSQEELFRT